MHNISLDNDEHPACCGVSLIFSTITSVLCYLLPQKEAADEDQRLIQLLLQPFNGLFSRTTWVSQYQKGKTNLDFTGARDSE